MKFDRGRHQRSAKRAKAGKRKGKMRKGCGARKLGKGFGREKR
jgi:hypothetical protein